MNMLLLGGVDILMMTAADDVRMILTTIVTGMMIITGILNADCDRCEDSGKYCELV